MKVREANVRIARIDEIIKDLTSLGYCNPGELIDYLQDYRNVLMRAVNKAELDI